MAALTCERPLWVDSGLIKPCPFLVPDLDKQAPLDPTQAVGAPGYVPLRKRFRTALQRPVLVMSDQTRSVLQGDDQVGCYL